jgi:hypothetical protein
MDFRDFFTCSAISVNEWPAPNNSTTFSPILDFSRTVSGMNDWGISFDVDVEFGTPISYPSVGGKIKFCNDTKHVVAGT